MTIRASAMVTARAARLGGLGPSCSASAAGTGVNSAATTGECGCEVCC